MAKIRITKHFNFEMAHALVDYNGACKNIHGHSYVLEVTLKGKIKKDGFVIDFKELKTIVNKNIVNQLDHALLLSKKSYEKHPELANLPYKQIKVDFNPTCENMLIYFVDSLKTKIPKSIDLVKVFLRETPSSYAEWFAEDN
jgi:6-pyruvoyltetrahydropterin/6-carboxytetrahydropterin synthase